VVVTFLIPRNDNHIVAERVENGGKSKLLIIASCCCVIPTPHSRLPTP